MAAPYEIPEFTMAPADAGLALAVMIALLAYLGGLVFWVVLQSVGALRIGKNEDGRFDPRAMTARFASRIARRRWRS